MRYREILEAQKLTFASAKDFVADLETGRGRIADLAQANPWLVQMSQQAARDRLGATFSVWRAIAATDRLRPDGVVSTSLSPRTVCEIAIGFPGIIFQSNATIKPEVVIRRYDITPEHVRIWVPAILDVVKQAIGKRMTHSIEDRYGERVKLQTILRNYEDKDEQEIIADLHGIKPAMTLDASDKGILFATCNLSHGHPEADVQKNWFKGDKTRMATLKKFFKL